MDKQPTELQIKEFWEWCGFRYIEPKYCASCKRQEPPYLLKDGIGRRIDKEELTIDLNNLFKYAVPKVLEKIGKYKTVALVNNAVCNAVENKGKIEDYLFLEIQEVIKNGS